MANKFTEIASIKNGKDWTRGWVGAMASWLPNTDTLLELKSGGDLKLYEQVAQDDRVKSCLQQRFRALISHDWEVVPASDKRADRKVADFVSAQLQALEWDSIVEMMLWGIFYGYSVAEVLWEPQGDKVGIRQIRVRNRRRFIFDEDQMPRLRTIAQPLGEVLPERKFWYFASGADNSDEPYGRGLGHWLYWLVFFKKNDFRWWIRFLELFAQPARKGTYPAGATNAEKDILWEGLSAFGVDSQIMLPEGLAMEFLEARRSGTADYQAMIDQCNSAIATVIMSQNMTTEDGSSLSQAQVHEGVAASIVEADADLLCASFNRSVVRWLCDYNFPGLTEYPRLEYRLGSEPDLKALADRDQVLANMGFSRTFEYMVETYGEGFAKPEATTPAESPQPPDDLSTLFAAADDDPLKAIANKFKEADPFGDWLKQIETVLKESVDMAEFQTKISDIFSELPPDAFRALMAEATTLASLQGYSDSKEGK